MSVGNADRSAWARLLVALAVVALVALAGAAHAAGETYFVREGGSDRNDGRSAATAFGTIGRAIEACRGSGNTIWVGAGRYFETIEIGTGAGRRAPNGAPGRPNRILGDVTGAMTGGAGGEVVIDGENVREAGARIERTKGWTIDSLSFRGQRRYGVRAYRADDLAVTRNRVDVPSAWAVFLEEGRGARVESNELVRAEARGGGIRVMNPRGDVRIGENRFVLGGEAYLSSGFGRGGASGGSAYGVAVVDERGGGRASVRIENNAIGDCATGILAHALEPNTTVTAAHNTIVGCEVGIDARAERGEVRAWNNVVSHSSRGLLATPGRGRIEARGLLLFRIARGGVEASGGRFSVEGLIEDADPRWARPEAGNFAPTAGSPAIDAGRDSAGVGTDVRGVSRPVDGDGDGEARVDLGAWEFDASVDEGGPWRVVSWREVRPE